MVESCCFYLDLATSDLPYYEGSENLSVDSITL